jgi:hypothetical protein
MLISEFIQTDPDAIFLINEAKVAVEMLYKIK